MQHETPRAPGAEREGTRQGREDDGDPSALTIARARVLIRAALPCIGEHERAAAKAALGRVLATDLVSPMNVPRFRAAAMDGYAFRHADRERPLRVSGRSFAGHPGPDTLPRGHCVRITTGARVPDEADTVVQQENTVREGDVVRIVRAPEPGLHVRAVGSDSERGATLLERGTRLAAAELALLAAHGVVEVGVLRPLRLALFSTGDELVEAGAPLAAGQIHDANRALLVALCDDPAVTIVDLGICPDSPEALAATLDAARGADLVVSSGGVSVGETDHVRPALAARGEVALWKIAVKPGRPLTFGSSGPGQVYFGLPGNPVSAAVTTLLFVQPAVRQMLGLTETPPPPVRARLASPLSKRPGRVEYQRGRLAIDADGTPVVTTTGLQDSHVLRSLQRADCLIELPLESSGAGVGEPVLVHPFAHFGRPPL